MIVHGDSLRLFHSPDAARLRKSGNHLALDHRNPPLQTKGGAPSSILELSRNNESQKVYASEGESYMGRTNRASVVESVANLHCQHARIGKMRAAEGVAGIEHIPLIGDVGGRKAGGKVFAEVFAEGKIESVVAGEVVRTVSAEEAGAVVDGGRSEAAPGQVAFEAC